MMTKLLLFTGSRLPASAPIVGLPSYPWSTERPGVHGVEPRSADIRGRGCKKGAPGKCRSTQPKRMREDKKRKNLPKLSLVSTKERERRRGNRGFDDLQILTSPDNDDAQMSISTGRSSGNNSCEHRSSYTYVRKSRPRGSHNHICREKKPRRYRRIRIRHA